MCIRDSVRLVHKNRIIRTCLMYHAACKVEFHPFKRSYSQLTFFNFKKKKTVRSQSKSRSCSVAQGEAENQSCIATQKRCNKLCKEHRLGSRFRPRFLSISIFALSSVGSPLCFFSPIPEPFVNRRNNDWRT